MEYIKGLVSVVIPTYKRSEKLARAISSVLNQTYKNIELIVVNDNTPNDEYSKQLYELIACFKDKRLIFIEQEEHINGAAARNVGIRKANGEFIAFLDDDDYWKHNKIEKQVVFITQQNDKCGAVSTLLKFYKGNKLVRMSSSYSDGKIFKDILRRQTDVTTCSILLKHNYLDDAGYFDESLLRHQEIQLLSFFSYKYEIKLLKEYLTCIDISSEENMPNSRKLYRIKNDFFKSVEPIMSTLSLTERKRIYALHALEIALVEFRENHFRQAISNGIRIMRDPITFSIAIRRIISRNREQFIVRKYKN